jgi:hypothetical protein
MKSNIKLSECVRVNIKGFVTSYTAIIVILDQSFELRLLLKNVFNKLSIIDITYID